MADADCGQKNMNTAAQDSLYVNGKPIACHRLSDGNIYICRHENKNFCKLVGENPVEGDICLAQHLQARVNWHLFSQWIEYSDGYTVGKISVYNTKMEYSGVRIKRWYNEITIDIYVNYIYEGDEGISLDVTWSDFPDCVKKGVLMWQGRYLSNYYDSFGIDTEVQVTINIHEKNSGENYHSNQNFVDVHFMNEMGRSYMATSPGCIYGFPMPVPGYTWGIDNVGHIHAYPGMEESYSRTKFIEMIGHEFGHILGLGDAYEEKGRKTGTSGDDVPIFDIMRDGDRVTSNDIEMLLLAWKENEKQHFDTEFFGLLFKKSEAIKGKYYD